MDTTSTYVRALEILAICESNIDDDDAYESAWELAEEELRAEELDAIA